MEIVEDKGQYQTMGSVGGMGGSASAGGFNAGPTVTASGGMRGFGPGMVGSAKAGGDVRGNTAMAGGYNQGAMMAGKTGSGVQGPAAGGANTGGDVRNDTFGDGSKDTLPKDGYRQGDMFAGTTK